MYFKSIAKNSGKKIKLLGIKFICIVSSVILLSLSTSGVNGATLEEVPQSLRIGLTTYYKNQSTIHFYNNSVIPGFYNNEEWVPESTIKTVGGDFWFSVATKLYLESEQDFTTYEEALTKVIPLRESGYKAYATLIESKTWKVFVGHKDSASELDAVLSSIDGLDDVTYVEAPASYERIIMESQSNYPIIFENRYEKTVYSTDDRRGSDVVIDLGKRSYRGYIEVARYGDNNLSVVNILEVDTYLYSVVVSEVYASWPEESLKAQAVAARTFAIYYAKVVKKYPSDPYDLNDTVSSQVYKGYSVEDERVNAAVLATSEQMIYYDGGIIPAYFFASSGGRTENSENVWSGTVPYLKSVPDIYEQEPERSPWIMAYTSAEIGKILSGKGVQIGTVTDVVVEGYSEAGRAINLKIIGSAGSYVLKKENMRYWLGLYSRKFELIKSDYIPDKTYEVMNGNGDITTVDYSNAVVLSGDSTPVPVIGNKEQIIIMSNENMTNQPMISGKNSQFIFAGQGWGHGVGMSQAGAKGMAQEGYFYKEILMHYYSGVTVQ